MVLAKVCAGRRLAEDLNARPLVGDLTGPLRDFGPGGALASRQPKRPAGGTPRPAAARCLRQAYGLDPAPTIAYRQAVRTVEEIACPLVLPQSPKASLDTVRDRGHTASAAATAVHLVATLVHLLSSGALTRRDTPRPGRPPLGAPGRPATSRPLGRYWSPTAAPGGAPATVPAPSPLARRTGIPGAN